MGWPKGTPQPLVSGNTRNLRYDESAQLVEKLCAKCEAWKPPHAFNRLRDRRNGLKSHCRECQARLYALKFANMTGDEREAKRAYDRAKSRNWRRSQKAPDGRAEYRRSWEERNGPRLRRSQRVAYYRLRVAVLLKYGGSCVCCGEMDLGFLTIDHKQNNGYVDRKTRSQKKLLTELRDRPAAHDEFQVLCFNCNLGRAFNGGVCPHRGGYTERGRLLALKGGRVR